jgi:hypothetical protein
VGACPLGIGEFHHRLGACEVVEKLLRLALEELILFYQADASSLGPSDLDRIA